MPAPRKVVQDALLAALSHAAYGFNAQLASIASSYGIDGFQISWASDSPNFFEGYIGPDQENISDLIESPAIVIYTSTVRAQPEMEKGREFVGLVNAHADVYLQFRPLKMAPLGVSLPSVRRADAVFQAVEDAMIRTVNVAAWPGSVLYNRDFQSDRDPLQYVGDGWQARVACQFLFEVHI